MSRWFTRFCIALFLICASGKAQISIPGGVTAKTCSAGEALTAVAADGTFTCTVIAGTGLNQLTGDVTAGPGSGSQVATMVNIPTTATQAGKVLATAIVAPSTPAAGKGFIYEDSTSKNIAIKDDAGVVKHGVQSQTCTGQFVSAISDAGLVTCTTPASSGGSTLGSYASRPSEPCTNNTTYNANNAGLFGVCSSTVWNWFYGPIPAVVTSTSGSSLWINEGAGNAQAFVANNASGAGVTLTSGSNSGQNIQGRLRTVPATPYTYIVCMSTFAASGPTATRQGLMWTTGTTAGGGGSLLSVFGSLSGNASNNTTSMVWENWTNTGSFSADVAVSFGIKGNYDPTAPQCYALVDDGANRKVGWSKNKTDWYLGNFPGVVNTNFLTATHIGYYVNSGASQAVIQQQIFSEEVIASALF